IHSSSFAITPPLSSAAARCCYFRFVMKEFSRSSNEGEGDEEEEEEEDGDEEEGDEEQEQEEREGEDGEEEEGDELMNSKTNWSYVRCVPHQSIDGGESGRERERERERRREWERGREWERER